MKLAQGVDPTKLLVLNEQSTGVDVEHEVIHEGDVVCRVGDTDRAVENNQYRYGRLRVWRYPLHVIRRVFRIWDGFLVLTAAQVGLR
jgi:hypothetical protein